MDLQNDLNTFITQKTSPYAALKNAVFAGQASEELCLRLDPSSAVENRYLDGNISGVQLFSILAKSKTQAVARDYLDRCRVLDLAGMQQITDALFGEIRLAASPVFVSKSDAGDFIFSASFEIEYYTNN